MVLDLELVLPPTRLHARDRLPFRRSKQKQLYKEETSQRALVLGAGYVSAPVIEYLNRDKNVAFTVGLHSLSLFALDIG